MSERGAYSRAPADAPNRGDEREALWRRFVEVDGAYADYEGRTSRRLPVVVLEPVP